MLGKVLKYDMKRLGRVLLPLYLGTLLLSVLTLGATYLEKVNGIFNIISSTMMVFFVLSLIATGIGTFAFSIQKFYQNLLKDEGYLTNTLPVKKSTLITSKVISSCIYMTISVVVIIAAVLIGFQRFHVWEGFQFILKAGFIEQMMGMKEPWAIICFIGIMLCSYVMQLLFFFLAIALGQRHNSNRLVYSFVYGIVLYSIQEFLGVLLLLVIWLINPSIMDMLMNNVTPSVSVLGTIYLGSTLLSIFMAGMYYFGTVYIFNKKLNLE